MNSISLFALLQGATGILDAGKYHIGAGVDGGVLTDRDDSSVVADSAMAALERDIERIGGGDKEEADKDQEQRNYYANYFANVAQTSSANYYKRCPMPHNKDMSGYTYNAVVAQTTPECSNTTWQRWGPSAMKQPVRNPLQQPVQATVDLPGTVFSTQLATNHVSLASPIWAKMNDLGIQTPNDLDLNHGPYKSIQYEDQVRFHGPHTFLDSVHEFFQEYSKQYTLIHGKVVGNGPWPFLGFNRRGRKYNPSPAPWSGTFDYEIDQLIEVERILVPKQGWVQPVFTHADKYDDLQKYPMLQDNHHLAGSFNYVCLKGTKYKETDGTLRFKPDCRDYRGVYQAGRTYMVVSSKNFYMRAGHRVLMMVARGKEGEVKPTDGMSALVGSGVINTTGVANRWWYSYPSKSKLEQVIYDQYKAHDMARRDGETAADTTASDKLQACLLGGADGEQCAAEVDGKSRNDAVTSMAPKNLLRQLNGQPVSISRTAATINSADYTSAVGIIRPVPRRSQEIRGIVTLPRRYCRDAYGKWASSGTGFAERSLWPSYFGMVHENGFPGKHGNLFFHTPKECHTRGASMWALSIFKNTATLV